MKAQSQKIVKLLSDLSKDPKVKAAIDQLKNNYRSNENQKINNLKDLALITLKIGAKFVGRKRARVVQETLDALGILIQISFLIKANVLDRPEVQSFFKELWQGVQVNGQALFIQTKDFIELQLIKVGKKSNKNAKSLEKDTSDDKPALD